MRYLLFITTLAVALPACTPPSPFETLNGHWVLLHYEEVESGERYEKPDHVPGDVAILFSDKGRNGKFEGNTIINPIYGKYRLEENGTMSVREIAGNLQRDPDWADIFWEALEATTSYEVGNNLLHIYYDNGSRMMVFQRSNSLE